MDKTDNEMSKVSHFRWDMVIPPSVNHRTIIHDFTAKYFFGKGKNRVKV